MIDQLFREEVRRFPVLAPEGGWQPADREDLLGDFLADRLDQVTANLLALATDDASMGRLLRKSIRNWLIDQARKTPLGSLRKLLEELLADDGTFERVPDGEPGAGRWRLAATKSLPWSGATAELVEAARAVPNVTIPKWSSTVRRAPVADRGSLVAVARAVLTAAGGSLEIAQLVEVFVARFPVVLDPAVVPILDDSEGGIASSQERTPEELVVAAEDELDAATTAATVVGMLTPQERQIVPLLDDAQAVRAVLGCGRSQAYHHAQRLKEKLKQLVGESDDVRAVALEVIELCRGVTLPEQS